MMTLKEAAERVRAFADHRSLENLRTDWDAPWREAMKVCATAALALPTEGAPLITVQCPRCLMEYKVDAPPSPQLTQEKP